MISYSETLWSNTDTAEKWSTFMGHDKGNPSRYLAYYLIAQHVWRKGRQFTMAEVGFGGAHDFAWAWRQLQDTGMIAYVGFEIMADFVRWATEKYRHYDFRCGGFMDLDEYDITYTRHTLEHAHPDLWRDCLANLLRATNELCVLTWYMPPGNGDAMAANWTGQSWQNKYDKAKVMDVVRAAEFKVSIQPCGTNEIWSLTHAD